MTHYVKTCPICGEELEATVVRYLSAVVLDEQKQVCGFRTWEGNDADGYAWDHPATRVYCANDCEPNWIPPGYTGVLAPEMIALELTAPQARLVEDALRALQLRMGGEIAEALGALIEILKLAEGR